MLIQVVVSVMGSYILREVIDVLFREVLGLERHIYGNPDLLLYSTNYVLYSKELTKENNVFMETLKTNNCAFFI